MQGTRSTAVTNRAVITRAVAQKDIRARLFHQHVSKVLGAHGGLLVADVGFPKRFGEHLFGKRGLLCVVDGGWVFENELKDSGRAVSGRGVLGNFTHARLHEVQDLNAEGTYGAAHFAGVGDDVCRLTCIDHRD